MSTDEFGHNAHGMAGRSYEQQWSPDQSCPEKSEIKNEIKYYLRPWQTRTHCCGHVIADTNVFLCPRAQHLLRTQIFRLGQKMFLILFRNILCPLQMFPGLRSLRNIMGNNVSATMWP